MIKQIAFLLLALLILSTGTMAAAPAISVVLFEPNSGWVKIGGTVTMDINADAAGYIAGTTTGITINGIAATNFASDGDHNYTVTYTIADGHTDRTEDATIPISVELCNELACATYTTSPDAANSPAIDAQKPVTVATNYAANWNKLDQNAIFQCSDATSGCNSISVSVNGSTGNCSAFANDSNRISCLISSDSNNAVSFYSIDKAGNRGDTNTVYVLIDKTAPTVSNKLPLTDTNKVRPTVSFDVNDSSSGVNISSLALFINGALVTPMTQAFDSNYYVSYAYDSNLSDGFTGNIGVHAKDNVGNPVDANWSFKVDLSAPSIESITISDNGGYTSDTTPTITLNGVSGSPSQVAFSCNGTSWKEWQSYSLSISDFSLSTTSYGCPNGSNGSFSIYAKVKDAAGNESVARSDSSYLDKSSPSTPSNLSASAGNREVSLDWSASTDNGAIDYYNIYVNGSYRTRTDSSGTSRTITDLSNGTTYYFRVSAVDKAGNEGDKSNEVGKAPNSNSNACTNDDSAPYLAWESPASNSTVGVLVNDAAIVKLRVYAYDYECGINFVKFLVDGKPIDTDRTAVNERYTVDWNSETVVDGNHVLKATAGSFNVDDTENLTTKTITIKTSNGVTKVYLEEPVDGNKAAAQLVIGSAEDSKESADALVAELASFGALPGEESGALISSASDLLGDAKAAFDDEKYADAKKNANDAKAKFVQAVGMLAVEDYGGTSNYVFNEEHLDIMLKNLGFSQQLRDEAKLLLQGNDVTRSLSFKKVVDGDATYYKAVITLVVKNGSEEAMTVKVVEIVPKELAASASEIAGTEYTVLVDDPVLEWTVDLGAGEGKTIVYALKGELTAEEADDIIASGIINEFAAPPVLFKGTTNVEAMFLPASAGLFGLGGAVEIAGVAIIIGAIIVFAVLYVAGRNRGSGNEGSALDAAASRAGFGSGFFGRLGGKEEPSKPKWGYKGI